MLDEIKYEETKRFLHCGNCINQFVGSDLHEVMTPREYGLYEIGVSEVENKEIVVVWCRRCGMKVWDSTILLTIGK